MDEIVHRLHKGLQLLRSVPEAGGRSPLLLYRLSTLGRREARQI